VRERHLDYCLALAERVEAERDLGHPNVELDRLDAEHDNMRAALEWSLAPADDGQAVRAAEMGLRLAGALAWFWGTRGYWSERRRECIALLRAVGDRHGVAWALYNLGNAVDASDREAARVLYEESEALYRELGDDPGRTLPLQALGGMAHARGNYGRARALFE